MTRKGLPMIRHLPIYALLCAALALGACGSEGAATPQSPPPVNEVPDDAISVFADLEDAGLHLGDPVPLGGQGIPQAMSDKAMVEVFESAYLRNEAQRDLEARHPRRDFAACANVLVATTGTSAAPVQRAFAQLYSTC